MQSGRKPVAFVFDQLIDQSIDSAAGVPPGVLRDCINLRKDKIGKLVKRTAYHGVDAAEVSGYANPVGGAVRLLARGTELARINRDSIGSVSEIVVTRDRAPKWTLESSRQIASSATSSAAYSGCCSAGGMTFHVWINPTATSVNLSITNDVTGGLIRGPQVIGASGYTMVRVATDGTNVWIFAQTIATISIKAVCETAVDLGSGMAFPAWTTIASNVTTLNPQFDMAVYATHQIAMAYTSDIAGTLSATLLCIDENLNTDGSVTVGTGSMQTLAVFATIGTTYLWVAYSLNSAPSDSVMWQLTTGPSFVDSAAGPSAPPGEEIHAQGIGFVSSTQVLHAISYTVVANRPLGELKYGVQTYAASNLTLGSTTTVSGALMSSAPFNDGREIFVWVDCVDGTGVASIAFNSALLLQLTADSAPIYAMPHMRLNAARTYWGMYNVSAGPTFEDMAPQKVYPSSSDSLVFQWNAATVLRFGVSHAATKISVTNVATRLIKPGASAAHIGAETSSLALTSGGAQPFVYDGQRFTELGFIYPPPRFAATPSQTTGGSMTAGTYQYALTYEFFDAAGNRHQSAPQIMSLFEVTLTTNTKVTLTLDDLKLTTKCSGDSIATSLVNTVIWRTTDGPGPIHYRVATVPYGTATYEDTFSDASISVNEPLYTASGELANEMPPPLRHLVTFGGRLAGIDAEFPERIVFSKPLRTQVAPSFSSILETWVRGIGDLTALAAMDGALYAFSKTGVAVAAYGDGQDALGAGQWPQPQVLTRACGCVDPRAICVTQDGIVFCSRNEGPLRVWLLPRGGANPVDIGAKVQLYLDAKMAQFSVAALDVNITAGAYQVPEVVSCVNWESQSRVMLGIRLSRLAAGSDYATSVTLEYDYRHRGPDGLGVWSASRGSWDLSDLDPAGVTGAQSTTTVAAGKHWIGTGPVAIGDAGRPYTLASADDYLDEYDADDNVIATDNIFWSLETHDIRNGLVGMVKLQAIDYQFETADDATVTCGVAQGEATPTTVALAFATVTEGATANRQWRPPIHRSNTSKGYRLSLSSDGGGNDGGGNPVGSADVVPRAVSVDYLPLRPGHAAAAGERT